MSAQNAGCLGFLFRLFTGGGAGAAEGSGVTLPYRLRDNFLSRAELSFYQVLRVAVGDRAAVCCKVKLDDLFFVAGKGNQAYRNRIDRKHVDFLLCDPQTMRPLAGVELDASSHQREDRQAGDAFVDQVFSPAGLPLIHIPARQAYIVDEVLRQLGRALAPGGSAAPVAAAAEPAAGAPVCPKCGVSMVARTSRRGQHSGSRFWGCPNYPQCQHVVRID